MSLLVAGSLHLDVVLNAPHLPALDETVTGSTVEYVFGGKGGNQAVAAARLGADVAFVGRVGSDQFGDTIRDTLGAGGVNIAQLQRDVGPSGMSAAIVDKNGDYGAVIVSAANLNIDTAHIAVPNDVSMVLLQNEIPEAVNLDVARKAKALGAMVWLNAAPARRLSDELVEMVDLLIVNRVEAQFYENETAVTMLTTLGDAGVAFQGDDWPGFVVDVVSTHGAGDMFVGALAAETLRGADMPNAIAFAQAAAALHVSSATDKRAELTAKAVRAFLASQSSR